jgi:hypothetical protein
MFHPVMPPASQLISELEICFGVGYSAALEMLSYFAVILQYKRGWRSSQA